MVTTIDAIGGSAECTIAGAGTMPLSCQVGSLSLTRAQRDCGLGSGLAFGVRDRLSWSTVRCMGASHCSL